MEMFKDNKSDLPVFAETDILVCGGGPAGVGAAIRAAREGVKTMVIEFADCLGGIATAGMMSHWGGRSSSKILVELWERTYEKCKKTFGWVDENCCGKNTIHHGAQKIVLDEMAKEAGVEVLYYTLACGAIVENGAITGVVVQNKSGRGIIKAKRVIDATGDGDVATYAGVNYYKGRETDGRMQPCTIMFKIGGVDYSRAVFPGGFESKVETEKGELQALAKEKLPFPAGHLLLYRQPTEGTVCCNMTNAIEIDGTSAESMSKALVQCRSQIEEIIDFLHEYVPGYEKCWLMSEASLLGIRETRHFEGYKSLTPEDILEARVHDDWVVRRAFFNFDVHNLTGASLDKTGVQQKWAQPDDYSIPYGCILPKGVDNLLLSGRNISGTHLAHSNYRIMSVCMALGEAAGAAAAISIKDNCSLLDVDVKKIQILVGE